MAGANSIFYGDRLLVTSNPQAAKDRALLDRLGMRAEGADDLGLSGPRASDAIGKPARASDARVGS
jgi:biotin synthase